METEYRIASGDIVPARAANSSCVTTIVSGPALRLAIAIFVTSCGRPALLTLFLRIDAPIADEPIPASQAKMTCLTAEKSTAS